MKGGRKQLSAASMKLTSPTRSGRCSGRRGSRRRGRGVCSITITPLQAQAGRTCSRPGTRRQLQVRLPSHSRRPGSSARRRSHTRRSERAHAAPPRPKPPDGPGLASQRTVAAILANPRYTSRLRRWQAWWHTTG